MTGRVTDNADKQRYELAIDGQVVFADYRRDKDVVSVLHVEAPPSLRGSGAAGRFMQAMMQKIREDKLQVFPVCSYAVTWLKRHGEYDDLIASR